MKNKTKKKRKFEIQVITTSRQLPSQEAPPKSAKKAEDEFPVEAFLTEAANKMLPTLEIAKLAVVIAAGNQINPESAVIFAGQAIELWQKCEDVREKKIQRIALLNRAREMTAAREALPQPKNYPATLDECLRFWMPTKKRPEDRLKCYRDYWIENETYRREMNIEGEGKSESMEPIESTVDRMIEGDKKSGFRRTAYLHLADTFRRWIPKYDLENRKKRAKAGAAGLKAKREQNGEAKKN